MVMGSSFQPEVESANKIPPCASEQERAEAPAQVLSRHGGFGGEQLKQLVMPAEEAASGQLSVRVEVDPREVVFIKGLVEASDGLASVFCDRGGSLVLAAPLDRRAELAEFLRDLERDLGARVIDRDVFGEAAS